MSPPRAGQGNAPRDSLELASLASSESAERSSRSSSPSGISSSRKLSLEDQDPLRDSHEDDPESGYARAGQRSYSVSSAFDFGRALFPLSSTAAGGGYAPLGGAATLDRQGGLAEGSLERHKTLTYLNGLSLVVGLIIGSGIFSSPSQVNANAGSYGASLIAWVVAGVLAWTGAASYAELGGAIPLNGGSQAYLSKIFGELAGFLFAWCAVLVLKPGSAAIIAIVFGEYVVRAVVGADAEHVNPWIEKGVAVGGLALVILVNCVSTKATTRAGDILMIFKFIALVGITVTGIVVAVTGLSSSGSASQEWKTGWFHNTNTDISGWAVALYGGLWAFDGWDNTSYVTGEFKRTRDIPRVIHTAMPLVIISYILANVSYFLVLPQSTIESTNAIAVQFGAKVFGSVGSLVLALVVSMSCIGALNATIFTSGRLVYIAGKEGYLPSVFGKLGACGPTEPTPISEEGNRFKNRVCRLFSSDTSRTPINAMALNGAFVLVYIIVGEFKTLVTFYGVAGYTFYFLTVLGLIVLRIREPYLERPYKTWISTPIIFCCVSLFLLSRAVISEPLQTLIVVAFVLAGVPVYGWSVYRRDGRLNFGSFSRVFSEGKWKFWK